MTVIFTCGCTGSATGSEQSAPRCPEHLAPIRRIVGGKPKVTGPVQSPLKV